MKKNQKNVKNVETSQDVKLSAINLNKFAEQLSNVDLKQKKDKQTIYIYPEGWTKEKINSDEGKKFRNRIRSKVKSFSNNIFFYAKGNNVDALKSEIEKFDIFYKENFAINDLSIRSITNSEKKEKDIELMISIIKEVKGQ